MASTSPARIMAMSCRATRVSRFTNVPRTISRSFASSTRYLEEASSAPAASTNPKINTIVEQIQSLTLLEASELVTTLKERLNISDVPVAAAAAAAPAPAAAAPAEEEEKPKEKSLFTVSLVKVDASKKAKVIKEIKALMPNMNLVEAKKFVESVPQTLKDNATKEDVESLKKALEAAGAEVKAE